jgi:hypothetical protein
MDVVTEAASLEPRRWRREVRLARGLAPAPQGRRSVIFDNLGEPTACAGGHAEPVRDHLAGHAFPNGCAAWIRERRSSERWPLGAILPSLSRGSQHALAVSGGVGLRASKAAQDVGRDACQRGPT